MLNVMLKRAFAEAAKRPEDEQEAIASIVFEELHDEAAWQAKFARDAGKLVEVAHRVRGQIARGETIQFDPSNLSE